MEARTEKLKIDLLNWYKKNKRAFSWRNTTDPWQILLIETLSQQTQLERANEHFDKFLIQFPSPKSMANSSLKIILKMWSGLGYNNRAKRLYEASKIIEKKGFDQIYPNFEVLPGVGPYTKSAILSFAYGEKVLAIDTNIERIIQRYFGLNDTKDFFIENSQIATAKLNKINNQTLLKYLYCSEQDLASYKLDEFFFRKFLNLSSYESFFLEKLKEDCKYKLFND